MDSRNGKLLFLVFFVVLFFLPVSSCQKSVPITEDTAEEVVTEAVTQTEDLEPVQIPQITQGLITFISGYVQELSEGDWIDVEIGDHVNPEDVLRTDADSYCEVQFGDTAVVRIEENTEVVMNKIFLSAEEANVDLNLKSGNVLCKVQKLGGNDKFKVRTQTMVCGVRGTQFSVSSSQEKNSTIAVKEGTVTVLPSSIDVDLLKERVQDKGAEVTDIIHQIEESAPTVTANQEMNVDESTFKETEKSVEAVKEVVEQIAAGEVTDVTPEKIKQLSEAVTVSKNTVSTQAEPPKTVSAERSENFNKIDRMKMVDIPVAAKASKVDKQSTEPVITLFKISVSAEPGDADIILNGEKVGKGTYSGIFNPDELLNFSISRKNYFPHDFTLTASKESAKLYKIALAKIPEEREVTVKVEPSDASILLDGEPMGIGSFRQSFEVGKKLSFILRKEGFEEQTLDLIVDGKESNSFKVSLKRLSQSVTITTVPSDAEIRYNGEKVGSGTYTADFPAGETVSFLVQKEGYKEQIVSAEVLSGDNPGLKVTLEKLAETSQPSKLIPFKLETNPKEASISLGGKVVGTGQYSGDFKEGESLSFEISLGGYESAKVNAVVAKDGKTVQVSLKQKVIAQRIALSSNPIVGDVVSRGDIIFVSDSTGMIGAVTKNGKTEWTVTTKNSPNENSFPVLQGNNIYLSGAKELLVAESDIGKINTRIPLEGESAHPFGRRVVPYKEQILLPANSSIKILNAKTGEVTGEISIPKGSRMTPAIWKDKIVIVDQEGTLLIINPAAKTPIQAEIPTNSVQPVALSATINQDFAFFSGRKGTVICVDLSAKRVVWERKLGSTVYNEVVIGKTGGYVFSKNTIYGLSVSDGQDLFSPITGATSPPLIVGNTLYYGKDKQLIEADAATARLIKAVNIGTTVSSRPALSGKNIITGCSNGEILVINP